MAVALDNSATCFADASWTSGTSFTLTSYVAGGSNTYMRVSVYLNTVMTDNVTGVTWAGSATGWGSIGFKTTSSSTQALSVWGAQGLSGTQNIVVSVSPSNTSVNFVVDTWTGVDQTTPLGTTVTAHGTGAALSANGGSVPTNGVMVGSGVHNYSTSLTSGETILKSTRNANPGGKTLASTYSTSTGTLTFTASGSYVWAEVVTPINAVAAGGRTADLSQTLGSASLSGASANAIAAAVSQTLGAATLSATAANSIAASLSQTLGAATISSVATDEIAGNLSVTLGAATLSGAATSAIVAAVTQTLGTATLTSAASNAIVGALSVTLGVATLDATANTGAARTADLAITLDDVSLSSTGTVTQPASESTGAGGGKVMRKRKKRAPAFTVTQDTQQIIEQRIAALSVTLDDAQLVAECVMHEAPLARRRRQAIAVLLS